MPEDQIAAQRAAQPAPEATVIGVWPWHWDAVRVMRAMRRQWRTAAGMVGVLYLGLDMGCLAEVRAHLGIQPSEQLMRQLRVMEDAALVALNAVNED